MQLFPLSYFRLVSFVLSLILSNSICRANCLLESLRTDSIHPVSVCIDSGRGGFCGVCVLDRQEDKINGSIFNEFGITALNFEYDFRRGRLKLYDVISFLNKWYIKKIIKSDLTYLLNTAILGRRKEKRGLALDISEDKVLLENLKYHLSYTFSNITEDETIE